jgi:uncharacterized protein (TIGR02594 family)
MPPNDIVAPPWLRVALAEVGVKEFTNGSNKRIEEYLKTGTRDVALIDDDTAWCAGFANWVLKKVGLKGTNSLMAKSFMNLRRIPEPILGCFVVYDRPPNPTSGHVNIFLRDLGDHIEGVGGNQSDAVTIAKYPKSRLRGYYWPHDYPLPSEEDVQPPEEDYDYEEHDYTPPPQPIQPPASGAPFIIIAVVLIVALVVVAGGPDKVLDAIKRIIDHVF